MLHSKRNSLGGRKVSPPQPVCMTPDQKASYLANLRTNRPARPAGSRPLPARPLPAHDEDVPPRTGSALSFRSSEEQGLEQKTMSRELKLSHRASMPTSTSYGSLRSLGGQKGRPLVVSPSHVTLSTNRRVSPPSVAMPDVEYRESVARMKEREEAHALRNALQKIDHEDDEIRIHHAAKMEAADLVWRHRNPQLAEVEKTAAYPNPDLENRKYGELGSAKKDEELTQNSKPALRSASGGSTASNEGKRNRRLPWLKRRPKPETPAPATTPTPEGMQQGSVHEKENIFQKGARKVSGKRHVSSGSSKGVFRNPEDEIYEEAEEMPTITESVPKQQLPLRSREGNSLPRGSRPLPEKSFTDPLPDKPKTDRVEIWKNQPTQSRDAGYTATGALPQTPTKEPEVENSDSPRYKDGIEIRGDDIRAATSMRKSDRSPNLPTPTAVSDRPGRPIVSFDPKWRPGSDSPRNSQDVERPQSKNDGSMAYPVKPKPSVPEISIMEDTRSPPPDKEREPAAGQEAQAPPSPVVPSIGVSEVNSDRSSNAPRPLPQINLPDDEQSSPRVPVINVEPEQPPSRPLPQMNLPDDRCSSPSVPSINVESEQSKPRPLPSVMVQGGSNRPLPSQTQSSPSKLPQSRPTKSQMASRVPWLSRNPTSASTSAATCTACALPISGRIVTASGSSVSKPSQKARFHPECFICHHCSTGLECVSFYPEPENARLERIQAAMPHLDPEDPQIRAMVESNEDLHFFCHLDYHELFSPRCHNCKTPIEGAVILALGRHYHADHFFCAECGDPFSSESPFVEHNDYPYCVSCHTKRTSARCRACKSPILNEMTIEALGGKWHDKCFVCCECGGDFGEEGRFFVREVVVELTEKERRRGYAPRVEQVAACQGCEERRVKNVNLFL